MIKNKQKYKEDLLKEHSKKINFHEITNFNSDQETKRGRKMNNVKPVSNKKNNSTTCESKERKTKKGILYIIQNLNINQVEEYREIILNLINLQNILKRNRLKERERKIISYKL